MVAQRLTQITPPAAAPDQLWKREEAAWSAVPQEHIQSLFESMPRLSKLISEALGVRDENLKSDLSSNIGQVLISDVILDRKQAK
ncbi:hypothetical protein TNCV_354141 [Trichonephila clavipes]|uniref:Uncharacterized protein n=1 Tax=Trichonephila clavipes TaxID=2585209 RepID=A0A8X6W131_TRICX|nr:hypothetical protein TNCV_354141 [Trichonephila clavipes]